MIHLDHLAAVRVSGEDAVAFLHDQFSAPIDTLAGGESTFACYCSPKGRVIALLAALRCGADVWLIGSAELLPAVIDRLKMFVIRARVVLGDERLAVSGLPGDATSPPDAPVASLLDGRFRYAITESAGEADSERARAWRFEECAAGIPWLDGWTTERFLPQMVGAEAIGALSFQKGCYPGQEIVARTRYLGTLKRKPLRLLVAGQPPARTGDRVELVQESGDSEGVIIAKARGEDDSEALFLVARHDDEQPVLRLRYDSREFSIREDLSLDPARRPDQISATT